MRRIICMIIILLFASLFSACDKQEMERKNIVETAKNAVFEKWGDEGQSKLINGKIYDEQRVTVVYVEMKPDKNFEGVQGYLVAVDRNSKAIDIVIVSSPPKQLEIGNFIGKHNR
ncbi:hypothetical protein KAI78_06900 [bacterium]|nr:hypothetical protein [bacterium]